MLLPYLYDNLIEIGCDEVGRGCLAGSVYVAASILAKTYRDDYRNGLHAEFPVYGWDYNKGYPTKKRRAVIAEHGTTPYHCMTFNLLGDAQLELFCV